MSTQKALEVIVEMAAVYGVTLEAPALRAWRRVLADADIRDVEAAAQAWLRSEKWMPRPSEFAARVEGARLARARMEAQRWRELTALRVRAMLRRDPRVLREVAEELERAGRTFGAESLRRRAAYWESQEEVSHDVPEAAVS